MAAPYQLANYERYFTGEAVHLARQTALATAEVSLRSLEVCKEVLAIDTVQEQEDSIMSLSLRNRKSVAVRHTLFHSAAVGSDWNNMADYLTTRPAEYHRDTFATSRWSTWHARANNRLLSRVHGIEFDVVEKEVPCSAGMIWSVLIRDDGEIELSKDHNAIVPSPLRGVRRGSAREIGNIIAYANRAALLEITIGAIATATRTTDEVMIGKVAILQNEWAELYERSSGTDHAMFADRIYLPGFEFGPWATPTSPDNS